MGLQLHGHRAHHCSIVYTIHSLHYLQYTLYTPYTPYTSFSMHYTFYKLYKVYTIHTLHSLHFLQYSLYILYILYSINYTLPKISTIFTSITKDKIYAINFVTKTCTILLHFSFGQKLRSFVGQIRLIKN